MISKETYKLQFGLTIPQGWRSGDLPLEKENNPAKQYEFSKSIAITANNLGFDSLYAYDHFIPHYKDEVEKNIFECFTLLSAIAAITDKIKIGQIVACNSYRNPALLAKMLSTLDVISNGRAELGIGAGWHEEEYIQYGYNFPPPLTRIGQLDESISVIRSMWTQQRATFNGKHYSIRNVICNPKPVQKPHPVIMIGGEGERYLLKVVAKHADRYNHPCGSIQVLKRKISIIKDLCTSTGRNFKDIEFSLLAPCLVRETEEELKKVITFRKKKIHGIQQVQAAEYISLVGTPEHIRMVLNKYVDLGLTHFVLDLVGLDQSTIKLVDSKIIKKL